MHLLFSLGILNQYIPADSLVLSVQETDLTCCYKVVMCIMAKNDFSLTWETSSIYLTSNIVLLTVDFLEL